MGESRKPHFKSEPAKSTKLMVSGLVPIIDDGKRLLVEVRRGMTILTWDGLEEGKVAAVAVKPANDQADFVLQCHLPYSPDYRKLALGCIVGVSKDTVRLNLSADELDKLPHWRSNMTLS